MKKTSDTATAISAIMTTTITLPAMAPVLLPSPALLSELGVLPGCRVVAIGGGVEEGTSKT